jgi:phage terminase large subunit-like protein
MPTATKPRKAKAVSAKWRKLFRLLPMGYDPEATKAPGEWFDEDEAQRVVDFFGHPELGMIKHIEGRFAGSPFVLEPWQQAVIGCLFGWKRRDNTRRYREAFMGVPRGNGKTPLAAGICDYCLFFDGEDGAQIYSVATDVPQAALLFRHARGMIQQEPYMESRCTIRPSYRSIQLNQDPGRTYRVISSEPGGKHGFVPHLVICDEVHAWEGREVMDEITSAFAKVSRRQPLLLLITTRDFDRPSICNEKWDYAEKVATGVIQDSTFLPVLYHAGDNDDWTKESTWEKANPNLDVTVDRTALRRECEKAKATPGYENTFRRLHLNQKTEQDMRVISLDDWDACVGSYTVNEHRRCFAGLDLSSTEDLSSLGLVFADGDDTYTADALVWCPEERVKVKASKRVPYDLWARQGFLTATTGNVVDYQVIREDILRLRDEQGFEILEISFDAWGAAQLVQILQDVDGFTLVKTPQSLAHMSPATKQFLRALKAHKMKIPPNPLLRWCASNMAVHYSGKLQTGADLEDILDKVPIMPSKQSSADKIDPLVGIVLAFKSLIAHPEEWGMSIYDGARMVL